MSDIDYSKYTHMTVSDIHGNSMILLSLEEYERLKNIEEKYKKKRQEEINEIIVDARVRACEVIKKEMEEAIENFNLSPFRNYSNRYLN